MAAAVVAVAIRKGVNKTVTLSYSSPNWKDLMYLVWLRGRWVEEVVGTHCSLIYQANAQLLILLIILFSYFYFRHSLLFIYSLNLNERFLL